MIDPKGPSLRYGRSFGSRVKTSLILVQGCCQIVIGIHIPYPFPPPLGVAGFKPC
jgi:hypothetical protein